MQEEYKALDVDFEIPYCIQEDIINLLKYLNSGEDPRSADCYISNLKSDINSYDLDLSLEQQDILRNYYCRGGIFRGHTK